MAAAMVVISKAGAASPPTQQPPATTGRLPAQRYSYDSEEDERPQRRPRRGGSSTPSSTPRKGSGGANGWGESEKAAMLQRQMDELDEEDGDAAIRHGFSMEDAMAHSNLNAAKHRARTPTRVLDDLQRGNTRFWMGVATRPEVSAFERRALIMQQHPSVAILGCSDSRVPIEIVFDQGLGDMFVIRVAGNCLDKTTVGSLEYAAVRESLSHFPHTLWLVFGTFRALL
jgi:carbonic anhydrase